MKASRVVLSRVVLFAGLCFGTLAEEFGAHEACTAEDCSVSGSALVQSRPLVEGQSGPFKEDDVDETNEDDKIAEIAETDETGELLDDWKPPKEMKPCDKWPKKLLEMIVTGTKITIGRVKDSIEKCMARETFLGTRMKSLKEYYAKCTSPYGAFVQDSASEEEEDGDEEVADELLAEFDQPDEVDESNELVDVEVEKPNRTKFKKHMKKFKKSMPACDQIKKKIMKKIMAKIDLGLQTAGEQKANCKARRAPSLKFLSEKLKHISKCLEAK